jgi:hypothetical protein
LGVEGVLNCGMNGSESFGRSGRLEALNFSLAPSRRLMRVLGAVVLAQSLFVAGGQSQLGFSGCVGTKSIRDHSFWGETLFLKQLSQELYGSRFIAPALDQEVKDLALVVNRLPQPEVPTRDRDHHLIKMPA